MGRLHFPYAHDYTRRTHLLMPRLNHGDRIFQYSRLDAVNGPTLFAVPKSVRSNIIQIAAQYSKKKLNVVSQSPSNKHIVPKVSSNVAFPHQQYLGCLALNFLQFPAYSDGDIHLSGLGAIALYVAPPALKGSGLVEEAEVLQWINLAEHELLPAVLGVVSSSPAAKAVHGRSREEVLRHLDALNKILLTRTYLVGESVTLADMAVVCVLLPAYEHALDESTRSKSANVLRWFNTITQQPNFKSVTGDVKLFAGKGKN